MAELLLKITSTYDAQDKSITVRDDTRLYNALDNPGGWGSETVTRASITEAYLLIKFLDENKISIDRRIDVTSTVQSSVDEFIEFDKTIKDVNTDGAYKIIFIVKANTEYLSLPIIQFVIEDIEVAVSKHWVELALNPDIYDREPLEKECIWLESYLSGIKSVMRRGREDRFLNMLNFIQKRIKVNISNNLIKL
jgi:hypothetical protein